MPWTIPNINPKTDRIYIHYSYREAPTVTRLIELEYGFYTPQELADALTAAIADIIPGFQVSYGVYNAPAFVFLPPAGYSVSFSPLPNNTSAFPYPPTTKQLFDLLGLNTEDAGTLSEEIVGNYSLAQAIRYVDIVCPQLSYNQAVKDTRSQSVLRDSLCRIYLGDSGASGTFGAADFRPPGCCPTVVHRLYNQPKYIQWDPTQPVPGFLQFQVYDDAGALLGDFGSMTNFLYLGDWSMTLQVSEN